MPRPSLEFFSALDNPCTTQTHYRAWVIWRNPGLRVVDFTRVRDAERVNARELFGESLAAPTDLARQILNSETATGATKVFTTTVGADGPGAAPLQTLSEEDREKLREQLKRATSLDEISRIQRALRGGAAAL
ncbi:hypothetical protein D0Z00_003624 [Geotrichum galactomycetum]|uniref:Uncharacterized protein n=1 Tax=Geotrichum galactomycetum TaxID=27317 RepID=A0ACB6V0U0_9ASCO|nr:hypothetical protein D0Z00_003624 [Geotrichum candidum]